MSTVAVDIRKELADAMQGVTANVYSFVPESPIVPFAVIVPDSPYFEIITIGSQINLKVNMTMTVAVAYLSNPASLDNLEKLIIQCLENMPQGFELSLVEKPLITQVGSVNCLTADIRVSGYYTQQEEEE
jgi:hypothetical protein